MTYKFECDGCGRILPLEQLKGGHGEIEDPLMEELQNEVHTCHDCWNAFNQWRKDRYNNSGKGVNTGLSSSYTWQQSTGTNNWAPAPTSSIAMNSNGELVAIKQVSLEKEPKKKYTVKRVSLYTGDPKPKKKPTKNSSNKKAKRKRQS